MTEDGYLEHELLPSLAGITPGGGGDVGGGPGLGQLSVVWPTVDEVQQSVEGWYAGRNLERGEPGRGAAMEEQQERDQPARLPACLMG